VARRRLERVLEYLEHVDFLATWGRRIVSFLVSLGVGKLLQIVTEQFINLSPDVKIAAWFITSGILFFVLLQLFSYVRKPFSTKLDVQLTPSSGASKKQFLAVMNNEREQQKFHARCRLVKRLNEDYNRVRERSWDLAWERDSLRELALAPAESCNLIIAVADENRQTHLAEAELLEWSNGSIETVESSRWYESDRQPRPEYELEISVFGEHGKVTELFSLKCGGPQVALEMIKKPHQIKAPVATSIKTRILRWSIASVVLVLLLLVIITLSIRRPVTLRDSFTDVGKEYVSDLGPATSEPQLMTDGGDQQTFENGVQLYLRDFIYVLWEGGLYDQPLERNAPHWYKGSPLWEDDDFLRKMLNIPSTQRPPYGSMALIWQRDPQKWSKLSSRLWACTYDDSTLYFQDFEKGRLVGIYKDNSDSKQDGSTDDPGRGYILLNNMHWKTWLAPRLAPRLSLTDPNGNRCKP